MDKLKFLLNKIKGEVVYYQSSRGVVVFDTADNLIKKNLINLFSNSSRDKIWAASSRNISQLDNYDLLWYTASCVLYVLFLLVAIPLSPATISIFGTVQPAGILIFPLTFPIIDFITEVFGYKKSRNLVWFSAFCCMLTSLLLYITLNLFSLPSEYVVVFGGLPYLFLINTLCLIGADTANNIVFIKIKTALVGSKLWVRCMISTLIGQAFYTVLWICMFFGVNVDGDLLVRIIDNYGFKIAYSLLLIVATYFLVLSYNYLSFSNIKNK